MGRPRKNPINVTPAENAAQVPEKNTELFDIISTLAQTVQNLSNEVKEIKEKQTFFTAPSPVVLSIEKPVDPGTSNTIVSSSVNFLQAVPTDLLVEAKRVLGEKFDFKCEALADMPSFKFTVIVPPEYSPLKGAMLDERTKVIDNALGINGVREWCVIVKANVVKYLGQQITV